MKKNNRGFMLVEVIITSTVVLTAMIGLYATFSRVYSKYNEKNSYYSVEGVYSARVLFEYLLRNDLTSYFNNSNDELIVMKNGTCSTTVKNKADKTIGICDDLKSVYGVQSIIMTEYDKGRLTTLKGNTSFSILFRDYINYVINYYDIDNSSEFNYIILVELKKGNDYYYANLRVR